METRDDYPFQFACKRSGNCCTRPEGRVVVTDDDVPRIAAVLQIAESGLRSRFLNAGPDGHWLVRLAPDGACPWFERENGLGSCRIYEARPTHCETFPFWEELREDGPALREAMRFCPGITGVRPRDNDD